MSAANNVEATQPPDAGRIGPRSRVETVAAGVIVAAAVLPAVIGVVTRWAAPVTLVQDGALIDLRVRDVLSADSPLVGVYSQFGWNHPGPVLFWMLAPFSWVAGGAGWAMPVGTAAIQAVAIGSACWIAWRHGGPRWAAFWGALIVLSYAATGPWMVVDVWNPHIAFPIFILLLVMMWQALAQPWSYVGWTVVISSVLVQLHIGYLPLVAALLAALAAQLVVSWRRGVRPERVRRTLLWSGLGLAVLWVPVALDIVLHDGGNARRLVDYFVLRKGGEATAGLSAFGVAASQFKVLPPWAGGHTGPDALTGLVQPASAWWLVIPLICLVFGALVFRRCPPSIRAALLVSWVTAGAGLLALASVRGKLAPYVFYWQIPISLLVLGSAAAAVWSLVPWRRAASAAVVMSLGAGLLLIPTTRLVFDIVDTRDDVSPMQRATDELLARAESSANGEPIVVRWIGSPLGGLQGGLINSLEQHGVDVRTDAGEGFQFGPGRETAVGELGSVWYASEQGYVNAVLEREPGADVIAETTPLTKSDEQELRALQLAAFDQLAATGDAGTIAKLDSPLVVFDLERLGVLDEQRRTRLGELNQRVQASGGCRCSIVAFPPDRAPTDLVTSGLIAGVDRGAG